MSLTNANPGVSTVLARGIGGQFGDDADVPFTGAKASVKTGTVQVTFTGGPAGKSLSIIGDRGTVSGKPGVMVDGTSSGSRPARR